MKIMSDDIKEILDKLQKVANRETASRNTLMEMKDKDYHLLLDYITNLQQLYDKAIEDVVLESRKRMLLQEENKMYAQLKDEYEDIIDKAIEYNHIVLIAIMYIHKKKLL